MHDQVHTINDIILFNASSEDVTQMRIKIRNFKKWLDETGLENNLDNWVSYCEMASNDE